MDGHVLCSYQGNETWTNLQNISILTFVFWYMKMFGVKTLCLTHVDLQVLILTIGVWYIITFITKTQCLNHVNFEFWSFNCDLGSLMYDDTILSYRFCRQNYMSGPRSFSWKFYVISLCLQHIILGIKQIFQNRLLL